MAIQIFVEDPQLPPVQQSTYYGTGIAGPVCMVWERQEDQWVCEPGELPETATALPMEQVPADLQEEILALATRAEVIGPQGWKLNDG